MVKVKKKIKEIKGKKYSFSSGLNFRYYLRIYLLREVGVKDPEEIEARINIALSGLH